MNTTLLTSAGDAHSTPAADLSVNIHYQGYGAGYHLYRVTVTRPGFCPQPVGDDDRSMGHPDHAEAQALAEHYAASLVQVLTVEAEGITDERIAAVADCVNADLDAREQNALVVRTVLEADVAAIMAASRPVRITRTHVFRRPLSRPQLSAVRRHSDGVVRLGGGVTGPMLRSLADKGIGVLNFMPNLGQRKVIESLTLNAAGLALAEGLVAA